MHPPPANAERAGVMERSAITRAGLVQAVEQSLQIDDDVVFVRAAEQMLGQHLGVSKADLCGAVVRRPADDHKALEIRSLECAARVSEQRGKRSRLDCAHIPI